MTDEKEAKIMTGKPGRPKGVTIVGGQERSIQGGVKIAGQEKRGVNVMDKDSKTNPPPVEFTQGEGDPED